MSAIPFGMGFLVGCWITITAFAAIHYGSKHHGT